MTAESKSPEPWPQFKSGFPRWLHPFLWLEWLTEWIVHWLSRWAFIDLVKLIAGLSIVWAAIDYVTSGAERGRAREDQRKAKHYQAWQAINTARGQSGSGGRIDALEDLNRDGVSLASVDLSSAWMRGIRLPAANLMAAGMESATLIEADLRDANLFGASLKGANLTKANLRNAVLVGADLRKAMLLGADLRGAKLTGAKLDDSVLFFADLREAYLVRATLTGANLDLANLRSANLSEANFRAASFGGADLQGAILDKAVNWREIRALKDAHIRDAKNAPPGFSVWAVETMGASVEALQAEQWEKARRSIDIEILMQRPEGTK